MVREQFSNSCSKDLSVYLMERNPEDLEELSTLAEQCLIAHSRKLSYKTHAAKQGDRRDTGIEPNQKSTMKCFNCQEMGHRAAACPLKVVPESRTRSRGKWCSYCKSSTHDTRDCRAGQRPSYYSRGGANVSSRGSLPFHQVGCGMQIGESKNDVSAAKEERVMNAEPRRTEEEQRRNKEEREDPYGRNDCKNKEACLELINGEKIKVINGACLEKEISSRMPVVTGMVGERKVEVLRDTGCTGVIIKRNLVNEKQFTGEFGHIMTIARDLIKAPIAKVSVDTPYFSGTVEALCLKDPLVELIIGNVSGARAPNDPDTNWTSCAAVETRAQAKNKTVYGI